MTGSFITLSAKLWFLSHEAAKSGAIPCGWDVSPVTVRLPEQFARIIYTPW